MKLIILCLFFFVIMYAIVSLVALKAATGRIRPKKSSAQLPVFDADTTFKNLFENGAEYMKSLEYEEWFVQSFDRLKLYGRFYKNGNSKRTMILFHGFRSSGEHDFSCAVSTYLEKGMNLLIPDQRAHGKSEGSYIGYGVLERYDVLKWIEKVTYEQGQDCEIYLSGVSMGASTVLMASGLNLPKNVKGIIADCGFTSPEEIIKKVMKKDLHIPVFPLYYTTRFLAKLSAHYDFSYSTVDALKSCNIPVLFVHGKSDAFVPIDMSLKNFDNCTCQKRSVWVDGADHGCSFLIDKDRYITEFEEFFKI